MEDDSPPALIKSKPTQVQKGKAPMGPSKKTSKLALIIKVIKIQVIACCCRFSFLLNSGLISKNSQYNHSINKGMPYLAIMVKWKLCGERTSSSDMTISSDCAKLMPRPFPCKKYSFEKL